MKIISGKAIIQIGDFVYEVKPLPYNLNNLEVDEAYAFDDMVVVYRGQWEPTKLSKEYGFYTKNVKGETVLHLHLPEDKSPYSAENIREISVDAIFNDVNKNIEKFVTPEDVEIYNNNSEANLPIIEDEDDFLTRVVKSVIISKNVNLKNYAEISDIEKYTLGNMISSLKKSGQKMSVLNFLRWAEVLNFDFQLILTDNGKDRISPLKEDVVYDSKVR